MAQPAGFVLILEDDFAIAWDTYEMLLEAGVDVLEPVADNAAAIRLIANTNLRFCLLDYNLGRDTSAPTAQALAERNIPFAYLTGQPLAVRNASKTSYAKILAKPVAPSDIIALLDAVA